MASEYLNTLQTSLGRILGNKNTREKYSTSMDDAVGLKDVLGQSESFEMFMQHLSKEFSMESLLSLVEFTQFIKFVENRRQLQGFDTSS